MAQVQGDGVIIYFGYPLAHEDDAERAVNAGLETVAEVFRIVVKGAKLQARVGIATGVVVVGSHVSDIVPDSMPVVGETPNLAARLQTLADPGSVVISDSTHKLLGDNFTVDDLGVHSLKGLGNEIHAWKVKNVTEPENRFEVTRLAGGLSPLVGRREEILVVQRCWNLSRQGQGQVVRLVGEPGIGKSRIVRNFCENLIDDDQITIRLQCSPHHIGSAFHPLAVYFEQAAGFATDESEEVKHAKLTSMLKQSGVDVPVTALISSMLSLHISEHDHTVPSSPEERKAQTLDSLLSYFISVSEKKPVVFLVEDLHWSDPTTLEFLQLVISKISQLRILLLATQRFELSFHWEQVSVTTLTLERLNREETRRLAEDQSEDELSEELLDLITSKTDGIPLFVEELTRALITGKQLDPKAAFSVPDTLRDPLMARIDQLGSAAEVAHIGAVIGRDFSRRLLWELSERDEERTNRDLEKLTSSGLVSEHGQSDSKYFRFKHALIQEAAYENILKSKRLVLHSRLADVLSHPGISGLDTPAEILAHHLYRGGRPQEAARNWHIAGIRAIERSANIEALGHVKFGLNALEEIKDDDDKQNLELDLQIALGAAYRAAEGFSSPNVEAAFRRAGVLSDSMSANPQRLDAYRGLNSCLYIRGDLEGSVSLAKRVVKIATNERNRTYLMMGEYMHGSSLFWQGQLEMARSCLDRSLAIRSTLTEHDDKLSTQIDPAAFAQAHLSWTLWCLGEFDQSFEVSEYALALSRSLDQPYTLGVALTWASWLRLCNEDVEYLGDLVPELTALAKKYRYVFLRSWATMLDGALDIHISNVTDGVSKVLQSLEELDQQGAHLGRAWLLYWLAEGYFRAGDEAACRTAIQQAIQTIERTGARHWEPELHRLQGRLEERLKGSRSATAIKHYRKAWEVARKQQSHALETRALSALETDLNSISEIQ